ncbi:DNA-directed RNA polymerase subunit omega [Irregularibacter muris]|uniref:DNA-directed RNA polymerase subunit omega n=1 Tax=Irregularibacter muris TaxID=1796619 RepID=A0AAE3HD61_9FIRM|nr:DNA-directed RNA polymerase subunit omega [Irregularibacter muris]MCR1898176.1 DNA-directed RNA polymerase subunit omega [Irregularibacter muris]
MIKPSLRSLLKEVDNKYSLVVITAKRARQLVAGKEASIDIESNNPVTISTNEIDKGLIEYTPYDGDEN